MLEPSVLQTYLMVSNVVTLLSQVVIAGALVAIAIILHKNNKKDK